MRGRFRPPPLILGKKKTKTKRIPTLSSRSGSANVNRPVLGFTKKGRDVQENCQLEVNWLQSLKSDDDNSHHNGWLLDQIQVADITVAGFYRQHP